MGRKDSLIGVQAGGLPDGRPAAGLRGAFSIPVAKSGFSVGILAEFNVTKKFRGKGSVFPYVNFAFE